MAAPRLYIGIGGTRLAGAHRQLFDEVQPAGVILFARNIESRDQLQALIGEIKQACAAPPRIAIDHENQRVNRLRDVVGELPALADVIRENRAKAFGRELGRQLRGLGIDLDFAPVLDLQLFDGQTDNALRERCWGSTADAVVAHAGAFIDGLQAEGVVACPKHFPGLGGARCDSHERLPTIDRTVDQLWEQDLQPYRALLSRCQAVMVGHGRYPALDPEQPASLSRTILQDWLRGRIGFGGEIFTDDLEMGAIADITAATRAARRAGADRLLVCHTPAKIREAHAILVS